MAATAARSPRAGAPVGAATFHAGLSLTNTDAERSYKLTRLLGEGSRSQVWLCTDGAGEEFAAKVALREEGVVDRVPRGGSPAVGVSGARSPGRARSPSPVRNALAREVPKLQAACEILGPLTTSFKDSFCAQCAIGGQWRTVSVIVMQRVEGCSLDALLARCPLTEVLASAVLRSVCISLFRLHASGIVHGDVSTSNILVDTQGWVYLTDFGASSELQYLHEGVAESTSGVAGAPAFRAPEVDRDLEGSGLYWYSCAADIWSLGMVAIKLMEGAAASAQGGARDDGAVDDGARQRTLPRLSSLEHSTNARDFVRRCLRKTPKNRATALELLESHLLRPCEHAPSMVGKVVAFVCGVEQQPASEQGSRESGGSIATEGEGGQKPAVAPQRQPGRLLADEDLVHLTPRFGKESRADGSVVGYTYAARDVLAALAPLPLEKYQGELALELLPAGHGARRRRKADTAPAEPGSTGCSEPVPAGSQSAATPPQPRCATPLSRVAEGGQAHAVVRVPR